MDAVARRGGETAYGIAVEHHHHAVCTVCERVTAIPGRALDAALADAGFSESTVTVHGVCRECRAVSRVT